MGIRTTKGAEVESQIYANFSREIPCLSLKLRITAGNPTIPWPMMSTPAIQAMARLNTASRVMNARMMARRGGIIEVQFGCKGSSQLCGS